MKLSLLALLLSATFAAQAQNVAMVNGKAVPKARADALMAQATKGGQPKSPELEKQVRDEIVRREILAQEAERKGVAASGDFKIQMEIARQLVLIRELQTIFFKTNPVLDSDAQAEYDRVKAEFEKAQAARSNQEFRARHILVENEADAVALIKQIKAGAKFEDLASKNSKDPVSAANGGDLDWHTPETFVPPFAKAMAALKKGEMTETPVKSDYGYHIIRVDDVREMKVDPAQQQIPPFADVKGQVVERLKQTRWAEYQKKLFDGAKTDYKLQ